MAVVARAAPTPVDPASASDMDIFVRVDRTGSRPTRSGRRIGQDLAFPPVMVYVFWVLGLVEPAFRTVSDAADPTVRLVLKVPALLADAGLALGVAYLARDRPRWAIVAALGVLLSPVVIYTSAWWGQFESIYVLAGLIAAILAIGGRPHLAAVALGVALMAKPQALAFVPPFVAWAIARYGWRTALTAGLVVAGTAVVLWLPFAADGGPMAYLTTLGRHQTEVFPICRCAPGTRGGCSRR